MLAIVLLLCQTPEKAIDAYFTAREKFSAGSGLHAELAKIVAEVQGPCATEDLKKRREKKSAENAEWEKMARQKYVAHEVKEKRFEGPLCVLTVTERFRFHRTNARGAPEEVADARDKRFVLEKLGERWLIQKEMDACHTCKQRGDCHWCEGSGKVADKECPRCKGTKRCDGCLGARWKERSFDKGMAPIAALDGFKARADRSSPRAAAEAYADALVEEQVRVGALLQRIFGDVVALYRTFYTPEVAAGAEAALKKSCELGAATLREYKPVVEELKEESETRATAVVNTPPSPFGPPSKRRIVLVRSGVQWLIDEALAPCATCETKGACAGCAGASGDGVKCLRCRGTRKCPACSGAGYRGE